MAGYLLDTNVVSALAPGKAAVRPDVADWLRARSGALAVPAMAFIGGFANLFGGFVGPWLVGWLRGMTGTVSLAFGVLAVFGVAGGLLVIAIRPRRGGVVMGAYQAG